MQNQSHITNHLARIKSGNSRSLGSNIKDNKISRQGIILVVLVLLCALFFGGIYADKLTPKANAADIQVQNVSWNGSEYVYFSGPVLYLITGDNYFERFVNPGEDNEWIESMENPDLTIWTQEPNDPTKISRSKKPYNTPGWEVFIGVRGTIVGPTSNDIEVMVNDPCGLEHRKLIAYNKTDPNTVYELDKSNWNIIPLPTLQNKQDEVYAIWIIATPPIVPGDIASDLGIGVLDGTCDIYDLLVIVNEWLDFTLDGDNYDWSDVNYDRKTNYLDFPTNWLESEPISKLSSPNFCRLTLYPYV